MQASGMAFFVTFRGGGPKVSVTMTLIFPKIVWRCPLTIPRLPGFHMEHVTIVNYNSNNVTISNGKL